MKETKRKGFNFFRSYYDVYNELEDKDKIAFMDALLDRQFLGKKPTNLQGMSKFAYISQVHSIDSQVKGYEDKTGIKLDSEACQGGDDAPIVGGSQGGTDAPTVQVEVQEQVKGKEEEEVKGKYIKPKVFNEEVVSLYQNIISLFPENTRPKNDKQAINWKSEIRKLIEIDGYDAATIEHVTRMAREDEFWGGNFLSISKLRKKNKEEIPYIVVFIEKFKHKIKKLESNFEKHQKAYLESVNQNGGIHPTDVDEHGQSY